MKKDIALEAIRGGAALVVVVWHVCVAFFPYSLNGWWQGSPLNLFMNGQSAVQLFFVLSGYVLTRRYFESGNNRILLKGAVKRWPRLMGPVLLVVLASYALFKLDLYQFEQAGAAAGSPWLIKFLSAYDTKPPIELWGALLQGSFFTFFGTEHFYNTPLWTMHPEFVGSFIAFGFAPILFEARKLSLHLTIGLVAMGAVLAAHENYAAFPIGVGLAALVPRSAVISSRIAYPALLMALYFLGCPHSSNNAVYHPALMANADVMNSIGAAILIVVSETFYPIRRVFSGRISQFLGDLSFPIYLVHVLIICSIGSAIYLRVGAVPAALAVFAFSILASLPLMAFNKWWVAQVNAATMRILEEPQLAHAESSVWSDGIFRRPPSFLARLRPGIF
jgi:peptidoglycan/LPS O-acetylase OafA/YrhL